MDRRERAVVPRIHRLEHVQGFPSADLANNDAVGSAFSAHYARGPESLTSPRPSILGGLYSRLTMCSCPSFSSAASSIVTIRSSFGMKSERTLRVVVFPAPVPPLTRMFSLPRTHASRKLLALPVQVCRLTSSSAVKGSSENLRMVKSGPVNRQRRQNHVHPRPVRKAGIGVGRGLVQARRPT